MNILTFDTEEWYIESTRLARTKKYAGYDKYLDQILAKLDERGLKATFFCVGKMVEHFPQVIRKIHEHGHEIGCHSNVHTWLNKMSEQECREDTHIAVDSLEQCIGQKVVSYRAPAFSIGEDNLWAFEVLAENGITRDASVFPTNRDIGGFPHFGHQEPTRITYKGIELKEFPIALTKVLGKKIAYSGGGYFRILPWGFVKRQMTNSNYNLAYIHIEDILPENAEMKSSKEYEAYYKESGTLIDRYVRYLKVNLGKKGAMTKLMKLIDLEDFINLAQADEIIDWEKTPIVKY